MEMTNQARDALITLSSRLTQAAAEFFPLYDGEGSQELRDALDRIRADVVEIAQRADALSNATHDTL